MAKIEEDRIRRIEELVRGLEKIPDRQARETARALLEAVLELHGAGLERMMDIVFDCGETGKAAIRRFANDELLGSLLVLHGLHPDDIETRVQRVLSKTQTAAELVGVFENVVRVRLTDSGCGLRESVEVVIRDAAPDAADVVVEEQALNNFVPLASLAMALPETG
jgi:hypothetical protein